ncbi:MAG TPA: diphthine--ammonia ligase [Steroidobacteraceae bacterium]|nr:diphthine--ammonia ligase [Steroidobacteraceae bacterium]
MQPAVALWSGGKDSALALDRVRRGGEFEVRALITTVNAEFRRVSMHGVREELIDLQSQAIGIPAHKMYVGGRGSNDDYVPALRAALESFKKLGITNVIFGDIFLEDLRQWRESLLGGLGMTGVFPLWKQDTRALIRQFIDRGFKAVVCCTNDAHLTQREVGRPLDEAFIGGLPDTVDPCGENGEYHSFVYDGPTFGRPIAFRLGEIVYRPLLPVAETGTSPAAQRGSPKNIPVPTASGPSATKGFWFVDLLPEGPLYSNN